MGDRMNHKFHQRVLREIADSEKARETLGRAKTWRVVFEVESALRKEHDELEKEKERLMSNLFRPSILKKARESIVARFASLELLEIEETVWTQFIATSVFHDVGHIPLESKGNLEKQTWLYGSSYEVETGDWVFTAKYTNNGICWRALHVSIVLLPSTYQNPFVQLPKTAKPMDPFLGFNKASLSYFQSCRVPPKNRVNTEDCTRNVCIKPLTNGCFVSGTLHVSEQEQNVGGITWKKLKNQSANAWNAYEEFILIQPGDLLSSLTDSLNFSRNIQNLQRKPRQLYSKSANVFWRASMTKHSSSSFFYSFLSSLYAERNELVGGTAN